MPADPQGTEAPDTGPLGLPVMPDHFFTNFTPAWSRAFADKLVQLLRGVAVTITPAEGWADYGSPYPLTAQETPDRRVFLEGLVKHSGSPLALSATVPVTVATLSRAPASNSTGLAMSSAGAVRWLLNPTGLQIMLVPGGTAATVATNGYLALHGINYLAAP
jgi:hypothetical protein